MLYRTLAHLSSGSPSLLSSFLAFLKKPSNLPLPRVLVPSIIPAYLVPLYQRACTTYDAVGPTITFLQSAAVLDVLHVYFRLMKDPNPMSTTSMVAMRVVTRLASVWLTTIPTLPVRCLSLP